MDSRKSVLIVDCSEESRAVLRSALEPRGMRVLEAAAAAEGLSLARRHHPDVIVLDPELSSESADAVTAAFASQTTAHPARLLVLGSVRRRLSASQGEFVSKPYHYAPLIRKIEALLAFSSQTGSSRAA